MSRYEDNRQYNISTTCLGKTWLVGCHISSY